MARAGCATQYGSGGPLLELSKDQIYQVADLPFSSLVKLNPCCNGYWSRLQPFLQARKDFRFAPHSPTFFHQQSLIAHCHSCEDNPQSNHSVSIIPVNRSSLLNSLATLSPSPTRTLLGLPILSRSLSPNFEPSRS